MSAQSRFKKFYLSDRPTFDFPSTESMSVGKVLLPVRAPTTITSRSAPFTPTPASSSTASPTTVIQPTASTSSTVAKRCTFQPLKSHRSAENLSHRPKIYSFNREPPCPKAFKALSIKLLMTMFQLVKPRGGALRTVLIFAKGFHRETILNPIRALRVSMCHWHRRLHLLR